MSRLRLLQIVPDTDPDPSTVAALALHASIASAGVEVRTLALAPGGRGGLDAELPVIAPARWSFAARTGVLAEERWADIVAFHGVRTLTVAAWATKRSPRRLLHLGRAPVLPKGPAAMVARRLARRADLVSTDGALTPADVTAALGVGAEAQRRVSTVDDWLVLLAELRPDRP